MLRPSARFSARGAGSRSVSAWGFCLRNWPAWRNQSRRPACLQSHCLTACLRRRSVARGPRPIRATSRGAKSDDVSIREGANIDDDLRTSSQFLPLILGRLLRIIAEARISVSTGKSVAYRTAHLIGGNCLSAWWQQYIRQRSEARKYVRFPRLLEIAMPKKSPITSPLGQYIF